MEVEEQIISAVNNSNDNLQFGYLFTGWLYDLYDSDYWLWIYDSLLFYWRCILSNDTLVNVLIYSLKYVPTGIFMYNFLKEYYVKSREVIKRKHIEIEELELQIEEMNKNEKLQNEECEKLNEELLLELDTIRCMREKIHEYISKDPELRTVYGGEIPRGSCDLDGELLLYDLLKDLNCKNVKKNKNSIVDIMKYAENVHADDVENSASSGSKIDTKKDCQVKIIKVTNVYKIAYLKNYIKKKRMRRANKQSDFNKKMDNVKSMLEEWQKMLTIGMRNKVIFNLEENTFDTSSQEEIDVRYVDSEVNLHQSLSELADEYDTAEFNELCNSSSSHNVVLENTSKQDLNYVNCNKYINNKLYDVKEETISQISLADRESGECDEL